MDLVCVDPKEVHKLWPFVSDSLKRAMYRGGLSSFSAMESSVLAGIGLLWVACKDKSIFAAAVTELQQTEWRKVCVIVACSGKDMHLWLPLIEGIEKFARAEGCSAVRIAGRRGWVRVLEDYRVKRVVLEKELD